MKTTQKTIIVLFCAGLLFSLSACHRGVGCPTWGKVNPAQTAKKSV